MQNIEIDSTSIDTASARKLIIRTISLGSDGYPQNQTKVHPIALVSLGNSLPPVKGVILMDKVSGNSEYAKLITTVSFEDNVVYISMHNPTDNGYRLEDIRINIGIFF